MSGNHHISDRARAARLRVLVAASALPLLVSCSSSSSVDYAIDAFPSQSLVDLLKEAKSSPPAAPTTTATAPPATDNGAALPPPASAAPPAREPAPVSATNVASPPPAVATSVESGDPVAAAFPSVSLIDLLKGQRNPGSQ